jgi:hypothetical protein
MGNPFLARRGGKAETRHAYNTRKLKAKLVSRATTFIRWMLAGLVAVNAAFGLVSASRVAICLRSISLSSALNVIFVQRAP